jgi:hypothetical protein
MQYYIFKVKLSRGSLFSGSSISVISSTCTSCSSLGFFLVSTFGSAGLLASTIMSNYQIPLRLLSVGLLVWALYSVSKKLTKSCTVDYMIRAQKKANEGGYKKLYQKYKVQAVYI